jgi:DNA-binding transcriptional ArsR family regulator
MSRYHIDPDVAEVAATIGDPGRAAMLFALLGGGDLPASELAHRAGVSPQAATAHLKKLVGAGLLAVRTSGRHRLFRLASPEVGHAIETLAAIAKPPAIVALRQSSAMQRLREARSCYDHLAGKLGVGVARRLIERGIVRLSARSFSVTADGARELARLGIDLDAAGDARRSFARACMDWTERQPHIAGSLGASILQLFLKRKWVVRNTADRSLLVTPAGRIALERTFHIHL